MNILVTGGAGFIGRYLAEKLLENNQVTIYDDLSNSSLEKISFLIEKKVNFIKGDVLNFERLSECKNFDVVIHLAAKSNVAESMIHPENTIDVNLNGTINVLELCVQNKIKKIIFASSAAVYGNHNGLISEKSATVPQSPYGQSKLDAEKIIKKTCQENNIGYVVFRMFNVYGKGQNNNYAGVIAKFLKNISQNIPLVIYGNGEQTRDFVSVNDVIDAFDTAIKSEKNGTYNIASGVSVSINELAEIIFDLFGKVGVKYLQRQKGDIQDSIADITLARKELGFNPSRKLENELARL